MKVLIKWAARLLMVSGWIWAIYYLIWKYSKTTVVEESSNTMPIPILILIIVLISIVTIGGFVIMLLSWWEQIKKDKFSFYTFAPITLLMIGVIVVSKLLINKVAILIEINTAQFMSDMQGYTITMNNLLLILCVSGLIGLAGFIYEHKA